MGSAVQTYAFINAKLRARISKLTPVYLIENLTRAHSLEEAVSYLHDTPFQIIEQVYRKTGDLKMAELELLRHEIQIYREIGKYMEGTSLEIVIALFMRYEIDSLKNGLRLFFDNRIRGRDITDSVHYILNEKIIHNIPLDKIVNVNTLEEAAELLNQTPYGSIVREQAGRVSQEGSLFPLEVALDHFYYRNLFSKIEKLEPNDRKIAQRLIGVEVDLQNLNWIIRFRSFYQLPLERVLSLIIPGGLSLKTEMLRETYASQDISKILKGFIKSDYPHFSSILSSRTADLSSRLLLIEKILEQIMDYEIKKILTGYPFTIGILFAYFILKEKEIKKIRTILNAKQYGISEERLRGII